MGLVTGSTTTNISGSNRLVLDTSLTSRFPVDDYFKNQWYVQLIPTSGDNQNAIRRVIGFTNSSGTLTCSGATGNNWESSESGEINYELTPFDPTEVTNLFNEALEIVYPDISMVRDVETIVTGSRQHTYTLPNTIRKVDRVYLGNRREANSGDNLLLNGDFEDWDSDSLSPGSQNNWTLVGSGATFNKEAETFNPENYMVLSGNNSGRLKVASATTTLLQTFTPASSSYTSVATEGQEVNLSAWVYCNTASKVKLYITDTVVGSFHGGTGWELMKASATLAHDATTAVVGLSVAASDVAAYIDEIWMTIGQSEMTDVPYSELRNWDHVPPVAGADDGGVLYFQETLPSKHRIRIVGRDMLTPVSSDTSTVEVDGDLIQPLYDKVRQLIALRMASGNISPNSNWTEMARQYEESYVRAVEGNLVKVKSPPTLVPRMVF
tara:strand:+ start:389 stop:1702 length:1314 start_codon:yes stop_codon:yes gene_type:complete